MLYGSLVDVAFIAAGYRIGKQVGRLSREETDIGRQGSKAVPSDGTRSESIEEDDAG